MYSVKAIRNGEEQAFKLFYEAFYDRIYHFIAKRTDNETETKDLIQEVFLKILENRAQLTDDTSLEALAFTIARNVIVDHYRKSLLQEKYHHLANDLYHQNDTIQSDEFAISNNNLQLLQQAIEDLPDQRKTVFKLSKYNGWTSEEIAEELSLSKRTVENHIYRATKILKAKLAQFFSLLF